MVSLHFLIHRKVESSFSSSTCIVELIDVQKLHYQLDFLKQNVL